MVTPIPTAIKISLTRLSFVAKTIVAPSVNHKRVMVLIFSRKGIPSFDK